MAVVTLGSPSFDPTPLASSSVTTTSAALKVIDGSTTTAMIGETDPIFTAWDRTTGISITESQISDLGLYLLPGDNVSELTNDSGFLTTLVGLNISDLTNDSVFLTTETDPVFTAWDKSTGISVDTANIVDSAITANKTSIAAINPTDGEINTNKVGTLQIADDAISSAKIQNDAITAAKLNVLAISATGTLNANTVGTTQIDDGAVTHALLANDAIEANNIATAAVTGPAIQSSSILAGHIAAGEITATHILTGALDATHITSFNFIVTEGTFTNNSPTAGQVAWVGCKVMYDGVEYTITDGSCLTTDVYIYWEYTNTTFSTSDTLPALGNNDFIVATNDSGTYLLAWNSTVINGNRITTGSITSTQIAANTITANNIAAGTITADEIAAGTLTADLIKSYNFQLITENPFIADTPTTDQLSWSACEVMYGGTKYSVTAGSCLGADVYIYWELATPTVFLKSETLPNLSQDGFIVVTNGNTYYGKGTPVYVWNATTIDGNRITAGSISASLIAAGTITADKIGVGEITATQIKAGTITADKIGAGEIEASHLSVTAGATFVSAEGGSYSSDVVSHPRVRILPDSTIGFDATNASGSNVFRIDVGGSNPGDVTIGDYAGGQGILYDASLNKTFFEGDLQATTGTIGAWSIDADSLYTGTKVTGDGYATTIGDMTIRSDGSIHAKNFYINDDGEVGFSAVNSNIQTVAETGDTYTGSIKIAGNQIWEDSVDADTGGMYINKKGYAGGETRGRIVMFENGIGDPVMSVGYGSAPLPNIVAIWGKLYIGAGGVIDASSVGNVDPHVSGQVWNSAGTLKVSVG